MSIQKYNSSQSMTMNQSSIITAQKTELLRKMPRNKLDALMDGLLLTAAAFTHRKEAFDGKSLGIMRNALIDDIMGNSKWCTEMELKIIFKNGQVGRLGPIMGLSLDILVGWFEKYYAEKRIPALAKNIEKSKELAPIKIEELNAKSREQTKIRIKNVLQLKSEGRTVVTTELTASHWYDYLSGLKIDVCAVCERKEIFEKCRQGMIVVGPHTGIVANQTKSARNEWKEFKAGTADKTNSYFRICARSSKGIAFEKWAADVVGIGCWEDLLK